MVHPLRNIEDRRWALENRHPRLLILNPRAALLIAFLLTAPALSAALEVPPLRGRVNELAGLMPPERAHQLESRLEQFESETGHQVTVLTIPTLEGEDIEGFSIRVAESWKIGQKGFDNGVILIVAKNDRKLRIEVGYGLEGVLPDAIASRIIREIIVPHFRDNDFASGIEAGIDAILKVTRGESLPEMARPQRSPTGPISGDEGAVIAALFLAPFFAFMAGIFFGMFFRKKSSTIARLLLGGISGAVTSAFVASPFGALAYAGLGILIIILGFSLGALGSLREFWGSGQWSETGGRRYGGWGTGGGFGGGGFGGGGGFSGGGGGFGGGGASGSW